VNRLLSLAAGTVLAVAPADAVDVAAAAGWPAVGIWFDPATWTPATTRAVRERLDATGLVALDVEPVMLAPDSPVPSDDARRLVDAAMALGARHVLVASRDPDAGRVGAALAALCEQVAGTPVRLCLEFLPILAVRTLAEAAAIVGAVDHPAAGILVDELHLARSGAVPGDLVGLPPAWFPYAQVCGISATVPDGVAGLLEEALHGRLLPGEGVAPTADLLAVLPAGVPVSAEIRSRPVRERWPDPVERARAVLAATAATCG